jgi:TRAP-type C4-dicarboxylate transport system substrate-binding protein
MLGVPLADASGAVVLSKKKFDTLPTDLQEILLRNGRKYMAELTKKSREENTASIQTMKKNGIQMVDVTDPKTLQDYMAIGKAARQSLVGKLYDQSFLDRVEKTLVDFRAGRRATK